MSAAPRKATAALRRRDRVFVATGTSSSVRVVHLDEDCYQLGFATDHRVVEHRGALPLSARDVCGACRDRREEDQ